jgi:hypothetical protein
VQAHLDRQALDPDDADAIADLPEVVMSLRTNSFVQVVY